MPEHRYELIAAMEEIDLLVYQAHPEILTAGEVADWQKRAHDAHVQTVEMLRDDQELIDSLDLRIADLESRKPVPTGLSTAAWILVWLAFCFGFAIGGLLL